jgi:addiction module RelE/StbE family toxin
VLKKRRELSVRAERVIEQLAIDPLTPSLASHKLKGALEGYWSCTVDYEYRVLFEFVKNEGSVEDDVILHSIGTHDAVY